MADQRNLFAGVGVGDFTSSDANMVIQDGVIAGDAVGLGFTSCIFDSIGVADILYTEVDSVLTDSVSASDVFDFLRNILHLAKRIFTLRLRR